MQIQGEMSRIENMHFGNRIIFSIGFTPGYGKRSVIATPKHQERRVVISQPLLPRWIRFKIVLIVIEKVQLNVRLPRLIEEIILINP